MTVETRLADPTTYSQANTAGAGGVAELTRAREQAESRVAQLTDRWEELEAKKAALADR